MSPVNPTLDSILETWYYDVYRFAFLISGNGRSAEEITFQTFLYVGADSAIGPDPESRGAVFGKAWQTCEEFYLRRMRRIKGRKQVQESAAFPVSDKLWQYLKLPVKKRAALFLMANLQFTPEEAAHALGPGPGRAGRLWGRDGITSGNSLPFVDALPDEEVRAIMPDRNFTLQFGDSVFLRFEERSVGLENRLRQFRLAADRAVPWIAVGILILFAAAVIYTAGLS